ncbi:MAG: formate dehydrogenase accessory protein FdhE [Desulfobacter sp.]|nr:MAG: formate dehydrogenase accessory protein FdhE [Desulfobacter sp.]
MSQEILNHPNPSATTFCVNLTEDQIRTAAGALQKIRPAYGPIIEFYSRVFRAQAAAMAETVIPPIILEKEALALKGENEMPLVTPVQFRIDVAAAKKLMGEICNLAVAYAPKLSGAGENMGRALAAEKLDLPRMFTDLLDGMDMKQTAEALDIPAEALALFGFSAMAPSIQACALQLAPYLEQMPERSSTARGYCPVCGSAPNLALFDETGARHVSCSLCSHIWPVPRMGCLFCDSQNREDQQYFFTGDEAEYRVYCCNNCRRYIKAVDVRQMGRRLYPKLEQIATIHLDMKAGEEGYRPPVQDGSLT